MIENLFLMSQENFDDGSQSFPCSISMIRSTLDFGAPLKTFLSWSSVKCSRKKARMSVRAFQQPIIFRQGSPSFMVVQYENSMSIPN